MPKMVTDSFSVFLNETIYEIISETNVKKKTENGPCVYYYSPPPSWPPRLHHVHQNIYATMHVAASCYQTMYIGSNRFARSRCC